jgi:15-cis-phytoene synthase
MISIFNDFSTDCTKALTKKYSTSFAMAVRLLKPKTRKAIYNIYGFVRIADEIVDTFHDYPKKDLLEKLDQDYKLALQQKISLNPVLNAFQQTIHSFDISQDLIKAFMISMQADLEKQTYKSEIELQNYVYGSAEVVGLMCLKVFVNGNETKYLHLQKYARALGSAFQKVNFLRDIQDDFSHLERSYFPNVEIGSLSTKDKNEIVEIIEKEFAFALVGIKLLPNDSKLAVLVAYTYYYRLLQKIKRMPAELLLKKRIRISNWNKFYIILKQILANKILQRT